MTRSCLTFIAAKSMLRAMLRCVWLAALFVACSSVPGQISPDASTGDPDATPPSGKRIVILMIGDGMGRGQLDAASHFKHGAAGQLALETLPVHGTVVTSGPSGITDSAAAATTLATGARTWNGSIGLDRDGASVETVVELAHRHGLPAGIVSTSAVTNATPAAFTAHRDSRHDLTQIADDQVRVVKPDVMLGGGAQYFLPAGPGSLRTDAGLLDELAANGYVLARTASELASAPAGKPLAGIFATDHLEYMIARPGDSTEPTLATMAMTAIERLDASPDGFFLMIEGSRIDMAGHGNLLPELVGETLAFDDTVAAVTAWAADRDDVAVIVTADHETGGLDVVQGNGAGILPDVTWRWGNHTNAPVDVYARGPGTSVLDGITIDQRWIHGMIASRMTGSAFVAPPAERLPDGRIADLPHVAAVQATVSGFGVGYNQLDALHLAADDRGFALGIAGVFDQGRNAVVVLIDVDFGAGTGPARLDNALTDLDGRADAILSSLSLDAPTTPGFGADLALVAWGATDPQLEQLFPEAGLRGLRPPYGQPSNLGWYGAAINFGDGTRAHANPPAVVTPDAQRGMEVHIPWDRLYATKPPAGATLAIAAVLVNDDGGFTSNQALPTFPAGTVNPGRVLTRLPGIVVFTVDGNADGVIDPISTSTVMP